MINEQKRQDTCHAGPARLEGAGVAFVPCIYDYVAHGGTGEAARQLGLDEHHVVKTLIMQDENGEPLVVLMHGDKEVSTKSLARQLGRKTVEPCAERDAQRYTGYQVGASAPSAPAAPCRCSWKKASWSWSGSTSTAASEACWWR